MKRGPILLSLLVCSLILATVYWKSLSFKAATLPNGATFTPSECWFEHSALVRVECGYLQTRSENPKIPSFKLPIVVLRHSWWQNSNSPMLHLSGGPGGAAYLDAKSMPFQIDNFEYQEWGVDFVLYDQRGTGLSEPALRCDGLIDKIEKSLAIAKLASEDSAEFIANTQLCLRQLSVNDKYKKHIKYVSTDYSVQDIADLHDLLNVEQWVLMGTSYGTRLALESARQVPSKIKSMVLDSVYPPEFDGFETLAENDLTAIPAMLDFCQNDVSCNDQYPNLHKDFIRALTKLKQKPLNVTVMKDVTDDSYPARDLALTADRFFTLLSFASYDSSLISLVPEAIEWVLEGGGDSQIRQLTSNLLDMQLDENFSDPVYMITECLENGDFDLPALEKRLEVYQAQFPMLDLSVSRYYNKVMCDGWRDLSTSSPRDYRAQVISDIPTLVLAGELDSVTPASWGVSAVKGLSNSVYLEYPQAAHAVLYSSLCSNDEVYQFLNPEQPESIFCDKDERLLERSTGVSPWGN